MMSFYQEAFREFEDFTDNSKFQYLYEYQKKKDSILRQYVILEGISDSVPRDIIKDSYEQACASIKETKNHPIDNEISMRSKGYLILAQYAINLCKKERMYKNIPIKMRSTAYVYYLQKIPDHEKILEKLNYNKIDCSFEYDKSKSLDFENCRKLAFHLMLCSVKLDLMATVVRMAKKRLKIDLCEYDNLIEASRNTGEPYLISWKFCNKYILEHKSYK